MRKGYLKFHIAVDVRTGQIVSMDVSSEKVSDGRRLKRLVRRAEESVRVKRVLADGGYDTKANFNFLSGRGIRPVIRVAKNSVPKNNGSYARKMAVIEQQMFRSKAWSRVHRFGYRWRAEGAFSFATGFALMVLAPRLQKDYLKLRVQLHSKQNDTGEGRD